MTQAELNFAVAEATGESVQMIAELGFVPLTRVPFEREPFTVYWGDENECTDVENDVEQNILAFPQRPRLTRIAA